MFARHTGFSGYNCFREFRFYFSKIENIHVCLCVTGQTNRNLIIFMMFTKGKKVRNLSRQCAGDGMRVAPNASFKLDSIYVHIISIFATDKLSSSTHNIKT